MSLPIIQPTTSKPQKNCCGCGGCESGYVHSIESMGMVDGPGIRTVVFLSGCPLRCKYCHNIDVTVPKSGQSFTPEELVDKVKSNKTYFKSSGGGVTFSGGEPLYQACFLKKCLQRCQKENIHTAVDTSLFTAPKNLKKIIPYTDLFMVSIKQIDVEAHQKLTGVSNEVILKNLKTLAQEKQKIWIRYVLIPEMTNTPEYLKKLVNILKPISPEKIELLPYHQAGANKWKQIGLKNEFEEIRVPTKTEIKTVVEFFEAEKFKVLYNS